MQAVARCRSPSLTSPTPVLPISLRPHRHQSHDLHLRMGHLSSQRQDADVAVRFAQSPPEPHWREAVYVSGTSYVSPSPSRKVDEPETDSWLLLHIECDKSFTRSDALAKHTRVQHPSLVPQSNASRSAGSSAAKTAFEAMLSIFPGGYPKGAGKRWEEGEEEWSRLDQSLGGKGKVPDRVEFTEDVVPSRPVAGKKKTKKPAGKKKKKRGDDSSSDLTEWEDDSVDELALLPPGGEDVDGGGAGSDSDDSLSPYLLPSPLLVNAPGSKPPIVQKYILAKGLHRSSLATRAGLEAELKELEVELKRVREGKDKALNDLLYREFGCVPFD